MRNKPTYSRWYKFNKIRIITLIIKIQYAISRFFTVDGHTWKTATRKELLLKLKKIHAIETKKETHRNRIDDKTVIKWAEVKSLIERRPLLQGEIHLHFNCMRRRPRSCQQPARQTLRRGQRSNRRRPRSRCRTGTSSVRCTVHAAEAPNAGSALLDVLYSTVQ